MYSLSFLLLLVSHSYKAYTYNTIKNTLLINLLLLLSPCKITIYLAGGGVMVKYTFKDLCSIKTGKLDANAAVENGAYPFFTCSKEPLKIDTYAYDCDCILLAGNGEFNVNIYSGKFNAYQRTYIIQVNDSGKTSLKYLFYLLKYNVAHLKNVCTGGVIKFIKLGNIQSITVPEADIKIQQKISIELDRLQNAIDLKKQQLSSLDDLVKSRFIEMFGDPEINEKIWTKTTMGNYITTLTDFNANGSYAYLDSNVTMYDDPHYALMVRTTDLERNDFQNGVKYIDENAYQILSKSKVFGGEIIMNKIGSAGKIYLMPHLDRPVSLGRNAFLFRYNENINTLFLYYQLSTEYGTAEILQHVKGATTKTITKDAAKSIKIIVPPIELQNEFADFVKLIDKSKFVCQSNPSIFCVKFLRFRHPP